MRCVKLVKPYSKKSDLDDDDDDYDDDDEDCTREGRTTPPVGRIMEHDVLSQAYQIGRSHPVAVEDMSQQSVGQVTYSSQVVQACLRLNTSSVL